MPISIEEFKSLRSADNGRNVGRRINWPAVLVRLQKMEDALTVKELHDFVVAQGLADDVSMVRTANWAKKQVEDGKAQVKTDGRRLFYYFGIPKAPEEV